MLLAPSLTLLAFNTKHSNIVSTKKISYIQKVATPKIDLHTAVLKNDIKTVKEHIAAKSDLNIKEAMGGSTPLISACLFGKTEIAKLLINAGANLNIQNNDGSTALITASFFCRPEIVKMLLAKKANKTIKNNYGQTALETLLTPFDQVKPVYEALGNALAPLGLKLDYAYIKKTRPVIAKMLK
ncbi:MAG: ankyrin repeat domain-containing protein [Flavobacteriales bacterium]|nr:ankyrin repeat domain-containing protein [Flavobacteriales bacterium]